MYVYATKNSAWGTDPMLITEVHTHGVSVRGLSSNSPGYFSNSAVIWAGSDEAKLREAKLSELRHLQEQVQILEAELFTPKKSRPKAVQRSKTNQKRPKTVQA
jgi:hypothetical protein